MRLLLHLMCVQYTLFIFLLFMYVCANSLVPFSVFLTTVIRLVAKLLACDRFIAVTVSDR
jgi:hypothetical protein